MKRFIPALVLLILVIYVGCAPRAPKREPKVVEPVVEAPPKLNVPKDGQMYKVFWVLKRFGRKIRSSISYGQYKKSTAAQGLSSWSPEWFYDSFQVPLNEKGHWMTVIYRTATAAVKKDRRIRELMENAPHHAIDVKLQFPNGARYLLTDTEADGVLDFAAPDKKKVRKDFKVDFPLLQKMQKRYAWILSIIKKSFKPRGTGNL
ncbi:MAG: hypothetical protein KAW12_30855 [Candidatus Aminicenantes bacterium]|nr:hypothetical protein [Candidatus Aminicenantes bacterium]